MTVQVVPLPPPFRKKKRGGLKHKHAKLGGESCQLVMVHCTVVSETTQSPTIWQNVHSERA